MAPGCCSLKRRDIDLNKLFSTCFSLDVYPRSFRDLHQACGSIPNVEKKMNLEYKQIQQL